MPLDRFLIAPLEVGLQTDVKPWLLPDSAYRQLNNAYIWRGRIRKRFGSRYMVPQTTAPSGFEQYPSRLSAILPVTSGTGLATGTLATDLTDPSFTVKIALGQQFSIGTQVFTIISNAAGAQPLLSIDTATNLPSGTATCNFATGVYSIQTNPVLMATGVRFYPGLPVMGLPTWQTNTINNEPTIAFDTKYAYQFTATGWERLALETAAGDSVWNGSDSQFFWAYTYQGPNLSDSYLFVTNFNNAEPNFMRYLDTSFTWNSFAPIYATPDGTTIDGQITSARIIVGFHDHLVLLNTWENDTVLGVNNFKNRARYCAIGTPLDTLNAVVANSYLPWVDNKNSPYFRGGGYIDNLQTQQQIVSAEFIKDRLLVYYERETWELVYTGNQQIPFVWQQINTEFGSQSTFSVIPFDTRVLAISQNGITECSGANVNRIDEKIPNEVFKIRNKNEGVLRVCGIRDYKFEMVYWSMPLDFIAGVTPSGSVVSNVYPNQVLTYNYKTGSWAYNTDSFTAFGYFPQSVGATWGNTTDQWQYMTATWSDGSLQPNFRQTIAGNQQGFVVVLDGDFTRNAGALSVTNASILADIVTLVIPNHNLTDTDFFTQEDEYVYLENFTGTGSWPLLNGIVTPIIDIIDKDTIRVKAFPFSGIPGEQYNGNGTAARVSNINILTKEWNPYNKQGQNVFIQKINFLVERTDSGAITVDYYPSTSTYSILQQSVPGQLMSSGVLQTSPYDPVYYPSEQVQTRLWHVQYLAVDGTSIQLRMYMTDNQMVNPNMSLADFQLHAILLESQTASIRIGG